jgi:thiamine pyrophosphokinase
LIFAAAPVSPAARLRARLAALHEPYVVAADGGAATALAFGYTPDVVVGDFDSIDESTLAELQRQGVPLETHPRDKEATDGQLAIERALEDGPRCLWLLGFLGGPRLDQAMGNVLLLAQFETPAVLLDERNEAVLVRPGQRQVWRPERGELISLVPLSGDVLGVRTEGLRWPLQGAQLLLGQTRGVSNEPVSVVDEVRVSIERGLLLVTRHFPD